MVTDAVSALKVDSCENLSVIGGIVQWDTPGFSQATVTKVTPDADNSSFTLEFHLETGYNSSFFFETGGSFNAEFTDPKSYQLIAGPGWSTIGGNTKSLGADSYSLDVTNLYWTPTVGGKLLARGQLLFCNQITDSNNTLIADYNLLNCGGFRFTSFGNRATVFSSISLRPADFAPPGGTELPARCSSADGFHSSGGLVGPTWDSVWCEALDDDCFAVHGSYVNITSVSGDSVKPANDVGTTIVGHVFRFYEANPSLKPLGTATVTAYDASSSMLTFDNLPAGVIGSSGMANQNRVGSGYKLINSYTHSNRGRGIIAKASNGYIGHNHFSGVSYGTIDLGLEISYWAEADYVHNVTVENNLVENCNYLFKASVAIELHGDGANPVDGNSDIRIVNNRIVGTTGTNLNVGTLTNVEVSGNKFEQAFQQNYKLWASYPESLISTNNAVLTEGSGGNCVSGGVGRGNLTTFEGTYQGPTAAALIGNC